MKRKTGLIALSGIVGAAYALLTIILAPISYGAVQFRVSEVLCILPFFIPSSAWGLAVGCFIANLYSGNIFDMIFGTAATLIACLTVAGLGKKNRTSLKNAVLACLAVTVVNALIVGAVITWAYIGMNILEHPGIYFVNSGQVALGEAAVMFVLGLPLMRYLPKKRFFIEYISKFNGLEDK